MMSSKVVNIDGMSCGSCVRKIENAVLELDGIQQASVSLQNKQLTVDFDENKISFNQIMEVVESKGYIVSL